MEKRLKNELIEVIAGLIMIIVGVALFLTKASLDSTFLKSEDMWNWWKTLLVLIPLMAGIVMLIFKPHFIGSKIVAIIGAIFLIVVIFMNTTIILNERIALYEWIIDGILVVGGMAIVCIALFYNRKKCS